MTKSKVLIVGFGGVGIVAGYTLERNGKADVVAVARSNLEKAQSEGYNIESVDYGTVNYKPSKLVKTVEEAAEYGPYDYVVVTTKNTPDIFKTEDLIEPVVTPKKTIILLSQNGIGIEEPIIKKFPGNIVLSGVSMISSNKYVTDVKHVSTDILGVGYFDDGFSDAELQKEAAENFIGLYANEFNDCKYDPNVKYARWRKLVYNATLNSICTLTGVDSGRLDIFGGVDGIVRTAMREVLEIAKSDGIDLPESIMETMIRADDGIWCTPSMLVDVRKGNFIECEVISGNPVRIAKKNGVSAPYLTMAYELLKVVQGRLKEEKGLIKIPKERPIKA
ncbi:uncharacterized protein PRCAT00004228001 [Priceomyces carsonii]|uniref:uncharacterized protein n=1 Tax=Priceomyces carsonii TaxID=28549 RepID=UPI002ED94282|nr:unnamed protein product [Priceomyces carsonii]